MVGGESADENGSGHGGRWEVTQRGEEGEHFLVPLRLIAGEAEEEIPLHLDMESAGVAERGDIGAGFDPFAHELEERGGEGFDAELDFLNFGLSQQRHALEVDVGLFFVEHDGLREFLSETREQGSEIGVGHDIISHGDGSPGFFEDEIGQFGEDAIGVFGAIDHAVAIEATEGAVAFFTPPATPTGFVSDECFPWLVQGAVRQPGGELGPKFGGTRGGDGIHIGLGTAVDHAWGGGGTGSPIAEELSERLFAFAFEHVIDAFCDGGDPLGHGAFAIRTAEEGECFWGPFFDCGEQRDGGVGLLEHGGAADDLRISVGDKIGDLRDPSVGGVLHSTQEIGVEADATRIKAGLGEALADLGDLDFEVSSLVMSEGRSIKSGASEHPFSGEHGDRSIGEVVIGGFAELSGEVDIGVEDG